MPIFDTAARRRAEVLSDLVYCNPFLGERIELERAVLGTAFDESTAEWNVHPDWTDPLPNITSLTAATESIAGNARRRIVAGASPNPEEKRLYSDVVLLNLYYRHRPQLDLAVQPGEKAKGALSRSWESFARAAKADFACMNPGPTERELARIFAFFIQICRAFHHVFDCIIGASPAVIRLRGQVWQSIFTHDLRRYRDVLYTCMGDHATLVTGPSGTGKELVARAIGQSRYLPFDPRTAQLKGTDDDFHALNLSALSPQLIEAELFGHKRGAFTGAVSDRKGWLENCTETGAVFLDEIGEIEPAVQVKLLRVLEDRCFSRVGETRDRRFTGKLIAATNRDLAAEMDAGRFRTDLYYRLCADTIRTPSLRERLVESDTERHVLLTYLARRMIGESTDTLVSEVEEWIDRQLGPDYPWPGNVRELEQCLRNVMIRGEYHPAQPPEREKTTDAYERLAAEMRAGTLNAEAMLRRYCRLVYEETGSYAEAARRLELDRRTVRDRAS